MQEIIAFIFCFSMIASAKEGFGTKEHIPEFLAQVQSSVFQISGHEHVVFKDGSSEDSETLGGGTAFALAEDANYFYFVTANHVIESVCRSSCDGINLYQNGESNSADKQSFSFKSIQLVKKTKNPDYAVFAAKKDPKIKYGFSPLKLSNASSLPGEKLYAIGFPNLDLRGGDQLKTKRWSEGIYIGVFNSDNNSDSNTEIWLGTTVDAEHGNSGGPILNSRGEVVGLLVRGVRGGYTGNEQPGSLRPHSFGMSLRN